MKKIFSLVFLFAMVCAAMSAQTTTPRFYGANNDNTGRALNYKYTAFTDAAGTDSVTIRPNAWNTYYKVTLTDSVAVKSPVVTSCYFGDQIFFVATGNSGTKLKFVGTNWVSTGKATLSTSGKAIIRFMFDGAKFVEVGRLVQ